MKIVPFLIFSESVRKLLEVEGLTDAVMTKDKVRAYRKGEEVFVDSFSEDELISFVGQTIPVRYEKEWGERAASGNVVKYSFCISDRYVVRVNLYSGGVVARFIPLDPLPLLRESDLAPCRKERFFHVEAGGKCSGKTTRIFAQVLDFCRRSSAVVFAYERPQEIYAENVISVSKDDMSIDDFADLVISSPSSLCIVQHASESDMKVLRHIYNCGVNVIAEVRGKHDGGDF